MFPVRSLCSTCAAPMCEWLLRKKRVKGMKISTVRCDENSKGHSPYDLYIMVECPFYQPYEEDK